MLHVACSTPYVVRALAALIRETNAKRFYASHVARPSALTGRGVFSSRSHARFFLVVCRGRPQIFETNVKSFWLLVRAARPHLSEGSSIVFNASMGGYGIAALRPLLVRRTIL
jgi:hypothetical protein